MRWKKLLWLRRLHLLHMSILGPDLHRNAENSFSHFPSTLDGTCSDQQVELLSPVLPTETQS